MKTDEELKSLGFSNSQIWWLKMLHEKYYRITEFYDEYMGHFELTQEKVIEHIETISTFLEEYKEFSLRFIEGNYYIMELNEDYNPKESI